MKLSILVCSVHTRYNTFLPKIQKQLYEQYNKLSDSEKDQVEIIILTDNKKIMLGHKRNLMVDMAQGEYVVFVDDDDRIDDNYIKELLNVTSKGDDVIVFQAIVTVNDKPPKVCYYSKDVKQDYNTKEAYYRIPNHICCVKREIAEQVSFPNILYGEDSAYSKLLVHRLKSEYKIDKVLYYYDYNSQTTETQYKRKNNLKPRKLKPVVDIIILSKATNSDTQMMTQNAVNTCYYSANALPVNIIVIENGNSYKYQNAKTIHRPEQFNYNKFANYGARLGNAEWVMIANNDLTFKNGYLHELLGANHDIVSPHEPDDGRQQDITENIKGYDNGRHFSGWCFMIKRSLWESIGRFDENIPFWCADDSVIEQLKSVGIEPMLVKNAIVEHNPSTTLRTESKEYQDDLKWGSVYAFNKKYNKNKFADKPAYKQWVKGNIK